jgi:hypothetical protein
MSHSKAATDGTAYPAATEEKVREYMYVSNLQSSVKTVI